MTWGKISVDKKLGNLSLSKAVVRHCFVLFFILFSGVFPISSYAQENSTPWRENLSCVLSEQKYKGIEYCTGLDGKAHVIIIDLHESGVRAEYVIALGNDRDYTYGECEDVNLPQWSSGPGCYDSQNSSFYPIMSLLDTVDVERYPDAAAVINTDYGATDTSRGHGPEGFTVVHGNRIDGPAVGDTDNNAERRPWLAISQNPPLRAEFDQFDLGEDDGSKPEWVYTGVGGAPWLIRDGQIDNDQIDNCTNATQHSCTSTYAQTAIALSQDGRWLYAVVVVGADAKGTAQFLYDTLQPWQAIKLDGGGSSQLWYQGSSTQDHVVFAGDNRKLSQYLAIFAESGSGIVDDSLPMPPSPPDPEEEPPIDSEPFWQNILDSIGEWWAGIQEDVTEWWEQTVSNFEAQIEAFFADLEQQVAEWIENQLQTFFDQLCGTAMLPIGGIFFWWFGRNWRTKG